MDEFFNSRREIEVFWLSSGYSIRGMIFLERKIYWAERIWMMYWLFLLAFVRWNLIGIYLEIFFILHGTVYCSSDHWWYCRTFVIPRRSIRKIEFDQKNIFILEEELSLLHWTFFLIFTLNDSISGLELAWPCKPASRRWFRLINGRGAIDSLEKKFYFIP